MPKTGSDIQGIVSFAVEYTSDANNIAEFAQSCKWNVCVMQFVFIKIG